MSPITLMSFELRFLTHLRRIGASTAEMKDLPLSELILEALPHLEIS